MAALTIDERQRIEKLEDNMREFDLRLDSIEKKLNTILSYAKGIAIGIGVGGLIFGYFSLKQLLEVLK
jgi:hypothetical protein